MVKWVRLMLDHKGQNRTDDCPREAESKYPNIDPIADSWTLQVRSREVGES